MDSIIYDVISKRMCQARTSAYAALGLMRENAEKWFRTCVLSIPDVLAIYPAATQP